MCLTSDVRVNGFDIYLVQSIYLGNYGNITNNDINFTSRKCLLSNYLSYDCIQFG